MKKSKVKRFNGLMGSYATGVQGAYADSLPRKAKKDKEDRMALDMQDAIEPVYPLENLALAAPNVVRKGVVAGGRALSNAATNAAERAVARQSTAEGLPSSAALRRALGENNPKVVTTKGNFEEFAGFRGRHKALGSPEARNKILREEAEEAGIPTLGTSLDQIKEQLGGELVTESPQCRHGHRIFKTGEAKTGKSWGGWFCVEKTKASQCSPLWYVLASDGKWKPQV